MEYKAQPQVAKSHYTVSNYNNRETWMNFWHQVKAVLKLNPKKILEIGPGNKTVTDMLKKAGVKVVTVDIDPALEPDVVASVLDLPFEDLAFDAVLCSEVLEHLPYEYFIPALKELSRVSGGRIILGLPNAGAVLRFDLKIPILKRLTLFAKIPFFWKEHKFNGEHYWETGKKGCSRDFIRRVIAEAGFKIEEDVIHSDDPAHWLMVLEKI